LTLLEEFAVQWGLKVEGLYIVGLYGYIMESNGQLWVWTHSHAPGEHEFLPIKNGLEEAKAVLRMIG